MDVWWIDEPHLLGSRNPTGSDLEQLRRDGFGVLISLLQEDEQPPRYDIHDATALGFVRHNIPVKDFHRPGVEQLEQFARLVLAFLPRARAVVHCEGGSGRTGTFAAAYWVAKGRSVCEAIERVRKTRPDAVETPEQVAALEEFAVLRDIRTSEEQLDAGMGIPHDDVEQRLKGKFLK